MDSFYCNVCLNSLAPAETALALPCAHIVCRGCADTSLSSSCPVCKQPLSSSSDIHPVKIYPDTDGAGNPLPPTDESTVWSLVGKAPQKALDVAYTSIQFSLRQADFYATARTRAETTARMQSMKNACENKIKEIHGGYKKAKRKLEAQIEHTKGLEEELHELRSKYQLKSEEARALRENVPRLQQENDELRHQLTSSRRMLSSSGPSHPPPQNLAMGQGAAPPLPSRPTSSTDTHRSFGRAPPPRHPSMAAAQQMFNSPFRSHHTTAANNNGSHRNRNMAATMSTPLRPPVPPPFANATNNAMMIHKMAQHPPSRTTAPSPFISPNINPRFMHATPTVTPTPKGDEDDAFGGLRGRFPSTDMHPFNKQPRANQNKENQDQGEMWNHVIAGGGGSREGKHTTTAALALAPATKKMKRFL